jgi:predicted ATPase
MTMMKLTGYKFHKLLYQGSRTEVYHGTRIRDNQPVMIKVLRNPHPNFHELVQFRNQYIITKHLEHPGIVQSLALESYGNGYALIMPDDGVIALWEYWEQCDRSLSDFLTIAIQLADALHYLNQKRIVHKDIKPANILFDPATHQVKLIDFSISSLLPKEQQQPINPKVLEGTLAYISPEQTGRMNRGIDYRTDYYSLGVTFYELLTGQLPFISQDPMELIHCHIAKMPTFEGRRLEGSRQEVERETGNGGIGEIPEIEGTSDPSSDSDPSFIPQVLINIVLKLMAKNAEDRYQSALGLKSDLEQCWHQLATRGEITVFELGQRDLCDRFTIPEKLYGRETEVAQLLAAFDRVANPPSSQTESGGIELMLVAGFSGIGKTAVINEVHKPIVRQRGYFIKGKFDQFNRNIPFSAFVIAFRELMGQLLGESDAALAEWKSQILSALGEQGQVIIEVIPELEEIIGPQPTVSELSGTAAQNRFNLLFQNLIAVFATPDHPLVIFLDDLQWADSASLNMMQVLIGSTEIGYLLLLGAYRDNEVFPAHPLMLTLTELEKHQATISTITLAPLELHHINQLVADTLSCGETLAEPLTKLVYQKTQGNPFFTTQFLKGLYEDKLIKFDRQLGYWSCDLGRVRDAALTSDVVAFMAKRLRKLPENSQEILKLAACISNQFDLHTLAVISESSEEDVASQLWLALQEGLILPVSENYKFFHAGEKGVEQRQPVSVGYRFLHDRVQQAAYSLIPETEKQNTHLKIGRLLLTNTPKEEQEDQIFGIVNQLNQGQQIIHRQGELNQLAELNFIAGIKAKLSTAYEAAGNYFNTAIKLLSENGAASSKGLSLDNNNAPWSSQYDLTLQLYQQLAEAQYLNGQFTESAATAEYIIQQAKHPHEQAQAYNLLVVQYTTTSQFDQAIEAGRSGLQVLGITIPTENFEQAVAAEQAIVQSRLESQDIFSLVDRPEMQQPEQKEATKLLIAMMPPAYFSRPDMWGFIVVKCARLLIEYGNDGDSSFGYTNYGLFLNVFFQQYRQGYEFGRVGLQLIEKFHNLSQKCPAACVFSTFISPWREPAKIGKKLALEGYQAGLESGNLQWAGYNLAYRLFTLLFIGDNLEDVQRDVETCLAFGEKHQDVVTIDMAIVCQKILPQLMEKFSNKTEVNLDEAEAKFLETTTAVPQYLTLKAQLEFLQEKPDRALAYAVQAKEPIALIGGSLLVAVHNFYYSLSLAASYQQASSAEKEEYWQQLMANQEQMQVWMENCPENFTHQYLLVAAEMARLSGDQLEAIELYDRAIAAAKEHNFIHNEGLANELAAKFYLHWGKEKMAIGYLTDAYYCYARWGAEAKTTQLEAKYPQLLNLIVQSSQFSGQLRDPRKTSSEKIGNVTSTTSWIDLASALKASQTISQEISLDALLSKLMQIIAENAGADRAGLILNNSGSWEIVGWSDRDICDLSVNLFDQSNTLPHSIINTVKRTKKTLLINHVSENNTFSADPYLSENQPLSLVCTPIQNQGKLIGLLY